MDYTYHVYDSNEIFDKHMRLGSVNNLISWIDISQYMPTLRVCKGTQYEPVSVPMEIFGDNPYDAAYLEQQEVINNNEYRVHRSSDGIFDIKIYNGTNARFIIGDEHIDFELTKDDPPLLTIPDVTINNPILFQNPFHDLIIITDGDRINYNRLYFGRKTRDDMHVHAFYKFKRFVTMIPSQQKAILNYVYPMNVLYQKSMLYNLQYQALRTIHNSKLAIPEELPHIIRPMWEHMLHFRHYRI